MCTTRAQCVQTIYMTRTCVMCIQNNLWNQKEKLLLMYDLDSKISLLTFLYGWKKCVRMGDPVKGGRSSSPTEISQRQSQLIIRSNNMIKKTKAILNKGKLN